MLSRNTFTYSAFTLGAVGIAAVILQSVMASLVRDDNAARIITAIVVAFVAGAMATICAIYFGATLRTPVLSNREVPPRRVFVSPKSQPVEDITNNNFEMESAPILVENGIARLLDTPKRQKQSTVVEWVEPDTTGRLAIRQIDVQTLRRFARMHTPCRAEWSGKNAIYSQCLAFFRFAGWVQPSVNNGVVWLMHYQKLHRRLAYLGDLATVSRSS